MALKKDATFDVQGGFSVDVAQAYIRVEEVFGTKDNCVATVSWLKEENSKESFKGKQYSFVPNMDGNNFIKQAYEHLKTLPEFAGAIDC